MILRMEWPRDSILARSVIPVDIMICVMTLVAGRTWPVRGLRSREPVREIEPS